MTKYLLTSLLLVICSIGFAQEGTISIVVAPGYAYIDSNEFNENALAKPIRAVAYEEEKGEMIPIAAKESKTWVFILLSSVLLVIGMLKFFFANYFQWLFQAIFNFNLSQQIYRDELLFRNISDWILKLIFILNLSLLIAFVVSYFNADQLYPLRFTFAITVLVAFAFYVFRHLSLWVSSIVFPVKEIVSNYRFSISLANNVAAIFLIPILFVLNFANHHFVIPTLIVCGLMLVALQIFRIVRGLQVSGSVIGERKFHFFLYICTLELLPTVLVYKAAVSNVGNVFN